MTLFSLALIALLQGITEFLPISSSGHLILLPALMHTPDQGLMIDVAVHMGTLGAVVIYFRAEVALVLRGMGEVAKGKTDTPGARLALALALATVPVVLAGLALKLSGAMEAMRSVALIGWTTLGFGLLLGWADRRGTQVRTLPDWTLRQAFVLGLWQAVALIPGTSRSGICITGARALGFTRHDAARISMLMSIPTILASGTLQGLDLIENGTSGMMVDAAVAAGLSLLAALAALAIMMRLLRSLTFTPYVLYRIALGGGLLIYAYS